MYKVVKNPVTSEEEKNEDFSEDGRGNVNQWIAENLRMIVSVAIVLAIAGGIYSYSKRAQMPSMKQATTSTEESSEGKISIIGGESESESTDAAMDENTSGTVDEKPSEAPKEVQPAVETQTSQETGTAFVETATKGEGSTHLARRALANYLEKNPDSSLTAEHKIFVEDLLRRQVKDGRLKIGDQREFSKDMIAKAIERSKGLNENQLKNLQKFSKRVSSLN